MLSGSEASLYFALLHAHHTVHTKFFSLEPTVPLGLCGDENLVLPATQLSHDISHEPLRISE